MTREEWNQKLENYFEMDEKVSYERLKELAKKASERNDITLETLLLEEGLVTETQMIMAKSAIWNVPYCEMERMPIDPKVTGCIPREKMIQYCCIPISFDKYDASVLCVVTDDLTDPGKAEELKNITNSEILFYFGKRTAILKKIEECYPKPNKEGALAAETDPKDTTVSGGSDEIQRYDINENWAHSGIVKAGDYCFLSYCVGNIGGTIEEQINGAFDQMEQRLAMVGLTLEHVVQMDCLFRDVYNIPVMEKVIKERFHGKYPARKSIQTNFAHVGGSDGLHFQADAVAYCGQNGCTK
jgi:enamine deaminase RidA (YjgF/YER057c/UK114 family)